MCPVRRAALRSISCKDILRDLKLLCKSLFLSQQTDYVPAPGDVREVSRQNVAGF